MRKILRVSKEVRKSREVKFLAGQVVKVKKSKSVNTELGLAIKLIDYYDIEGNKLPQRQILASYLHPRPDSSA